MSTAHRVRPRGGITVASVALGLLVGLASAVAQPVDRSFSPQLFHPAPGPDQFISVEPARPLRHKAWGVGLFFNYARNTLAILEFNDATNRTAGSRADLLAHALSLDLWAAVGIVNWLQLAVTLPMTLYQTGSDFVSENPRPGGTQVPAADGFALGDPRLHIKVKLYGKQAGFQLALSHWIGFPFGDDSDFGGERHFTGFSGEGRLLAGFDAERWRIGAFFGFLWRANVSYLFSTEIGQQLTYGGALAFDPVKYRFTILVEVYGRSELSTSFNNAPLEIAVAGKVRLIPGLSLNVGVGNGIVAGLGSPQPRVYLGVVYARDFRDEDKDGVPDEVDRCLGKPEDKDGFKDDDGCPDLDNDGDGILDTEDKCPNEAEDFDEFEDDDGCPDKDNDKDGIDDLHDACPMDPEDGKGPKPKDGCPLHKTDSDGDGITDDKDKCPTEPEDRDSFEDDDGCPDPDNDGDGIPDEYDQCPLQPEDADGFEDDDGCPDPDNDKDGVPDAKDQCPNEPETINGYKDDDGCPDKGPPPKVKIEGDQIKILDKVFFDTGKATIQAKSFNLLDQVALTIKAHPEFKITVEGHTDSRGKMDKNIQLSQERADAVRLYLIKQNIEPERLISVGYGPTKPIADNKTSAGREANRRVEFHIQPLKPPPKPAEAEGETPAPDGDATQQ